MANAFNKGEGTFLTEFQQHLAAWQPTKTMKINTTAPPPAPTTAAPTLSPKYRRRNSHTFVSRIALQMNLKINDIRFLDNLVQVKKNINGILVKNPRLVVITNTKLMTFVEQR